MSKRKSEYVYSDEFGDTDPYTDCARRRYNGEDAKHPDADHGPSVIPTELPTIRAMELPEAAVIPTDGENHIFYVRWTPRRNRDQATWRAVARFVERQVGSHKVIEARKPLDTISTSELAALEEAHGRTFDHGWVKRPAKPVEVEDAVYITSARNGMWKPMVCFHGLWFSLCAPISSKVAYAPTHDDRERARLRQQGFPDLALV